MASNFLKRKVEERAKKQEIERSSPAKSGGAETSNGKASSFLQKKAEESAEKTANLRAQWEADDRSHSSATKAQSSYKVPTSETNTTSSPSYSMTQAEYDMRRASNPTLPEYGSYEYYKSREETLRPIMEQIASDTDRRDKTYTAWVKNYDAGLMPDDVDDYTREMVVGLSRKFKYQDAIIAEYNDVMNNLNKHEKSGVRYDEKGEVDTASGREDVETKSGRYNTYLGTNALTQDEMRQGMLGTLPPARQAVYDEMKSYVDANSTESRKGEFYDYYDKVKDNQYDDDFWGQYAANYRQSDIGINQSEALGNVVQNPTEANKSLAEAWGSLLGDFQERHKSALDEEGVVLPWISRDFAQYSAQVVDRLPSQIVGGTVGGLVASSVGQPLKGVAAGAGIATTSHVFKQMQGQAYASLLEIGVDEETARKFATDEAIISSLIEGGDAALNVLLLGFGSSLTAVGNSATRAVANGSTNVVTKMISKLAPSAAKTAAKVSSPLWKTGIKAGGKLVLNAAGEYVEESTQEATNIANLKRAAQGNREGGIGNLALGATKTTWDAVTGKDKKAREQMHEAGGVGFRVGLLGGGLTMTANTIVSSYFNRKTIKEQNDFADSIIADDESLSVLIEEGKASGEGTVSAKIAKEVEAAKKNGKVTRGQVKRLIEANEVYIQHEQEEVAKQAAAKNNVEYTDGKDILAKFLAAKPSTVTDPLETARQEAEARATEAAYNAGKANVPMDKAGLATPAQVEAYNAGRMERIQNMGAEKPNPTKQSKVAPVTYETLESLSQANETIDVEDVKRVTGFGEEGSKMVADLANKDGVTFSQAKRMVESSYLAGYSQDDVARGYVKTDTQRAAFAAGEKDRLRDYSAKVEESQNATIHKGVFTENEYSKNLTSAERTMFSTIAKDLKMDIAMVDKIIVKFVEGKREIRREANASHEKGKMRISSTSELPMVSLAVHEGSHRMRNLDPESFDALMNFIYATSDQQATALQYGGIGESLFDQIHDDYSGVKGMDTGAYIEEIVAKRLETIFSDAEEFNNWRKTIDANPQMKSNWQKFCEWFKKVLEDMWASITNSKMDIESKRQAQAEIDRIKSLLADAYKGAMNAAEARAQDTNSRSTETPKHSLKKGDGSLSAEEQKAVDALGEGAKVTTNSNGEMLIATNKDKSTVMYSWTTHENGGKEALRKALKANGHTAAEIEETLSWVDDAGDYLKILAAGYAKSHNYTALSDHLIADVITNVKTGKQVLSAIVNNGEYPVNIDLALICKKRIAYMNLMTRLIDDGVFDKVNYGGEAIAKVNALLRADGFETACLGCFVESRRLQFQAWAETIVSEWNTEVDKRTKNAGSFNFAEGKANLTDAEMDLLAEELKNAGKKNAQGNLNLGQGSVQEKMGTLLDKLPSLRKHLTVADLLKPEGLTALRAYDSSLFSLVKSRYGAASPKIVQDYNPYASEIAMITFASVKNITSKSVKGAEAYRKKVISDMGGKPVKQKDETVKTFKERKAEFDAKVEDEAIRRYLYDIGGARIQSFSDFMIENVFDYIQIFADLSAKRLPLHGYTKEIIALRLFGMTGAKWNGSWIAHVDRSMGKEYAGLLPASEAKNGNAIIVHTEDGDFAIGFDDYARHKATNKETFIQSVGMKDMIALQLDPRYSPHVGSITIGVSDKHILAMLDSPHFRFVIPYHASGMLPQFAKLVGVDLYNDYTKYQNTTVKQWYDAYGDPCEPIKDVDVDTSYNFNAEVQKTGDAKKAADNYLKWCAQKHPVYKDKERIGYVTFKPKFSDSPYGTDFSSHENYYKLLEDFNSYDNITEETAVQGAVTMTFPSEQNRLTASEMEAYKARLRETGLFSEEEIEKYTKIADKTFKELIADEVKGRAEYHKAQTTKWESTVKSVEDMLLAEHKRDTSPKQYSLKKEAPTFYSHMGKTIDGMKETKIGAKSVIPYLTSRGVKAEEIKWSGIEAFLEGKKSVTKAELQEFAAGSMLQIEEETLTTNPTLKYTEDERESLEGISEAIFDKWQEIDALWKDNYGEGIPMDVLLADNAIKQLNLTINDLEKIDKDSGEFFSQTRAALRRIYTLEKNRDFIVQRATQRGDGNVKWEKYKLDGGENYRELLLKMPDSTYSNMAMGRHWDGIEGVLAHARIQDFVVDGKKMLFIEEIQSDWHNEGHKEGYEVYKRSKELNEASIKYRELSDKIKSLYTVFSETIAVRDDILYDEKMEKLRECDKKKKEYQKEQEKLLEKYGTEVCFIEKPVPDAPFRNNYHEYVLKRLIRMAAEEGYDSIGWTTADIQSERWSNEYAEGYRIEYDQDIPKFLNKYGKKWGAKVGKTNLGGGSVTEYTISLGEGETGDGAVYHSEREAIAGLVEYVNNNWGTDYDVDDAVVASSFGDGLVIEDEMSGDEIGYIAVNEAGGSATVWSMNIPDAMKDSVLYEGQPMYSLKNSDINIEERRELLGIIEHLKGEFELTKFAKADPKKLANMTRALLKEYRSQADFDETFKAIDELYQYMANGDGWHPAVWSDVYKRAYNIAQEIVKNAVVIDDATYREYKPLRDYLRTTPMKFDTQYDSVPSSYESFNEFRKRNMGRLKFTKDGMSIDSVYQELSHLYPEFFNEQEQTNSADQLERIIEVLDEIQPTEVNPFDSEIKEASAWLANDITSRFFDIPQAKPTFADKAERRVVEERIKGGKKVEAVRQQKDAKIEKIVEEHKDKTKKLLEAARQQRDDKFKKIIEAHREKTKKLLEKARESKTKAVEKEKAKRRDTISRMNENQKAKVLRARIMRHTSDLSKKLVNPTDNQHIPSELRGAVATLLECINLESNYTRDPESETYKKNDDGLPTKRTQAFRELKDVYENIASSVVVDPDLMGENGLLSDVVSLADKRIANMTVGELETVWKTIRAIEASINTANKVFSKGRFATILEFAESLRWSNASKTEKKEFRGVFGKGQKLAKLDMLTPETYFHYLGEAGDSIFRMMRDAQDKHISIVKEVQDFTHKELKGVNVNKLEKTLHTVILGGQKVKLTTPQIMELYVLMKRKQAIDHIFVGGILPDVIDTKGRYKISRAEPVRNIKPSEISAAISKLTDEEKAVADKLQKYSSTVLSQHGNEASLKVYNYEKFLENNYWPIRTNKQEIASDVGKDTAVTSVANKGMAKGTKPHANTSLRIGSIFNTFSSHSLDMATYAAWLGATEDINRIRNFVFWEDGARTGTVKGILDTVHGIYGSEYLQKLLTDISIGVQGTDTMNLLDKLTGYYKAASVGANIRVIIQQPTAILRALDMIDAQYIVAGAVNPLKGWDKAKKHAPIAQWKDWGHFDINTGRQMKDVLFDNASWIEKTKQIGMWGASMADSLAWGQLWNAVEFETRAKHKELEVGSEEYFTTVKKRFTEIVDHTQVVDGILQRSDVMRRADSLAKMATSFMGEPTKQYNMAMAAAYDAINKKGKAKISAIGRLGRTAIGLVVAGLVNACAQSIIDAMRDDDKEKDYWEKWMDAFLGSEDDATFQKGGNLVDSFNPINLFPYFKDVLSILQGYDVKRMDMESISKLVKSIGNMYKAITGTGKYTIAEASASLLAEIARVFGLPVSNVKRDVKAIIMTVAIQSDNYVMQYRIEKATLNINYAGNSKNYMDILFNAYNNDREAYEIIYNDMLKSGFEADKIKSGMESRMMKATGVNKASDLSKRYMTPTDEKKYDTSLARVKSSNAWKSANAEQRKNAEADLYNFLTSTSEEMEKTRLEAGAFGVDETEYTLWQLAKEMCDLNDNGSLNASEKAAAVEMLTLGDSEIAYFYNTDVADRAYAYGIDMESYALFKGAVADLENSDDWGSYTADQKKKAKQDAANMYAKDEREYLFLMATEYPSVKKRSDYIDYFGN